LNGAALYRLSIVWIARAVAIVMLLLTAPTIAALVRDQATVEPLGNNIYGALTLLAPPLLLLTAAEILATLVKSSRP
jgi:hypothetical protein